MLYGKSKISVYIMRAFGALFVFSGLGRHRIDDRCGGDIQPGKSRASWTFHLERQYCHRGQSSYLSGVESWYHQGYATSKECVYSDACGLSDLTEDREESRPHPRLRSY